MKGFGFEAWEVKLRCCFGVGSAADGFMTGAAEQQNAGLGLRGLRALGL